MGMTQPCEHPSAPTILDATGAGLERNNRSCLRRDGLDRGAVVLGIADDGTRIGTALDGEWLHHRIWELAKCLLTVDVRAAILNGPRILVVITPEALKPIRYRGKIKWRVHANCVDVDASSWHARQLNRLGFDWSAQPSEHWLGAVSALAVELAGRYLSEAGSSKAFKLAAAPAEELIALLNLVCDDDRLINAGALPIHGV